MSSELPGLGPRRRLPPSSLPLPALPLGPSAPAGPDVHLGPDTCPPRCVPCLEVGTLSLSKARWCHRHNSRGATGSLIAHSGSRTRSVWMGRQLLGSEHQSEWPPALPPGQEWRS